MAAEAVVQTEDAITSFLAWITFYVSLIGFVIQIWLVSRIYKIVGIGFALMVLPVSLGATALLILFNPVLWAPSVARVVDSATRYSLDKTTREVLFLPLPAELNCGADALARSDGSEEGHGRPVRRGAHDPPRNEEPIVR